MERSRRQQAGEEQRWRECRICLTKSPQDSGQWLLPCRCAEPFHRYCLQQRQLTHEARNLAKTPVCVWCGAEYSVLPAKGLVITALEKIAKSWYPALCNIVGFVFQKVVIDTTTFVTSGFIVLARLYGFREAYDMLLDMDKPFVAFTLCYSIPAVAVVINIIPWEDYCLRALRRWSRLPVTDTSMTHEALEPLPDHFDIVVGGLALPIFVELTGTLLFRTCCPVKRILLGGAVFLVVRGVTYMYYQHMRFLYQKNLTVANYQQHGSSPNNGYLCSD